MGVAAQVFVRGKPCSLNAKSKAHRAGWKRAIQGAAGAQYSGSLISGDIQLEIHYFHNGRRDIDTDNLTKPIADALNGVLFADDRQIGELRVKCYDLSGSFQLDDPPQSLLDCIANGDPGVLIRLYNI